MKKKKRRIFDREFKLEAVRLIIDKGYSIAEVSQNLGVDYSMLPCYERVFQEDPYFAFPGKETLEPQDEELRHLKRQFERVQEERDILK